MKVEEFDRLVQEELGRITELQKTKGKEYAEDADRLSNFKEEAKAFGVDPLVVLGIYMNKHVTLLRKYFRAVQEGKVSELKLSEPIEGRFRDVIVYALLGLALEKERALVAERSDGTGEGVE